ncbi:DUF732 domain-containing protein [Mycobacterium sp. CBMA293]|uniref:DUF732 domain-containing protein n=1 Tax=unclassified Mycolicibacterium TaxID=2636767 RepID=UPI0012DE85D8|nr:MULTISPECIES: DUF732 domain-containing protein [unclassified Mycolicibacterium]MUL49422.1 DUF732 domain-containing protein [Mycolicibacterium sp. CBMA 360]MUL62598.1 DUF732 domain-containing protein [Mycolicibacterium sp. CBMA 335]MUL69050.1 DUF732 domain-containing protein [Mycolicibacterium sp. CBMA 311]MUL96989.1 DUF732 domain-containing protein [Mycolicibacterium sp. CBMA 230]MUM03973.1 hypothetical protein [Mycolicibacterium sp. CBMA 213]
MKRLVATLIACAALPLVNSSTVHADLDTDFASQLHTYGIAGPRDYNAWIGKIVCQRIDNDVDHDAFQSARFLTDNLDRHNSAEQNWEFLSAAIDFYCPENRADLQQAAARH